MTLQLHVLHAAESAATPGDPMDEQCPSVLSSPAVLSSCRPMPAASYMESVYVVFVPPLFLSPSISPTLPTVSSTELCLLMMCLKQDSLFCHFCLQPCSRQCQGMRAPSRQWCWWLLWPDYLLLEKSHVGVWQSRKLLPHWGKKTGPRQFLELPRDTGPYSKWPWGMRAALGTYTKEDVINVRAALGQPH